MSKNEKKVMLEKYQTEFVILLELRKEYGKDSKESNDQENLVRGLIEMIKALGYVIVRKGNAIILREDYGMYEEQCRVNIY